MMPKHRLLISVAENPVANEIHALPIQHITPNSIPEGSSKTPHIDAVSPMPPNRKDKNRYTPPSSIEFDELQEAETDRPPTKDPQKKEEISETEPISDQPRVSDLNCNNEQSTNLVPAIVAILITVIAIFSLVILIYQSTNLTVNYESHQKLQEDSSP